VKLYEEALVLGERKQVEISAHEIEKQEYYTREVRRINDEQREKTGRVRKYIVLTYGCQMNAVRRIC